MEPRRLTNKQFNAHVIDRIEGLAADMGMDKNQLAGAIHEEIGITKRGALQYFNKDRRSIPPYSLAIIADWIGVDIAYIMLGTDDLSSCVKKHGRYAFATSAKETAAQ